MVAVVLIAKEPIPGKVKTRLHPALSYEQAAMLADAALSDTIAVVNTLPATRRILLFDGSVYPDGVDGWEIVAQASGGLDERIAAVFDHLNEPTVLIGMDTPQIAAADLSPVFVEGSADAWLGMAADGGFWALGMARPDGALVRSVPMSADDTGALQMARLVEAGLVVTSLPVLVDVDTIETAREVAALAPNSRFSTALNCLAVM